MYYTNNSPLLGMFSFEEYVILGPVLRKKKDILKTSIFPTIVPQFLLITILAFPKNHKIKI